MERQIKTVRTDIEDVLVSYADKSIGLPEAVDIVIVIIHDFMKLAR